MRIKKFGVVEISAGAVKLKKFSFEYGDEGSLEDCQKSALRWAADRILEELEKCRGV